MKGLLQKPFGVLGYLSMDFNDDGIPKVPWEGIPSPGHMLPAGQGTCPLCFLILLTQMISW